MLNEIKVAALADLAIRHLPEISEARKKLAESGSGHLGDEYILHRAPNWIFCNPLSTAIEWQAAHLLALTQMHPTQKHEVVTAWHPVEGEVLKNQELPLPRNLPETLEPAMVSAALLLCELSGESLPPWVQNTASVAASTSQREVETKVEVVAQEKTAEKTPEKTKMPASSNDATKPKARNTWPDSKLKALRQEHKEGASHNVLSEKYGCARQNISKYLKKAEEKFGRQKAGHFDAVLTWGKKK